MYSFDHSFAYPSIHPSIHPFFHLIINSFNYTWFLHVCQRKLSYLHGQRESQKSPDWWKLLSKSSEILVRNSKLTWYKWRIHASWKIAYKSSVLTLSLTYFLHTFYLTRGKPQAISACRQDINKIPSATTTNPKHPFLGGSAIHWNLWEYCAIKLAVKKSKMAASKLQMHVSPLPDKLSTKFQRLHPCFWGPALHWD